MRLTEQQAQFIETIPLTSIEFGYTIPQEYIDVISYNFDQKLQKQSVDNSITEHLEWIIEFVDRPTGAITDFFNLSKIGRNGVEYTVTPNDPKRRIVNAKTNLIFTHTVSTLFTERLLINFQEEVSTLFKQCNLEDYFTYFCNQEWVQFERISFVFENIIRDIFIQHIRSSPSTLNNKGGRSALTLGQLLNNNNFRSLIHNTIFYYDILFDYFGLNIRNEQAHNNRKFNSFYISNLLFLAIINLMFLKCK